MSISEETRAKIRAKTRNKTAELQEEVASEEVASEVEAPGKKPRQEQEKGLARVLKSLRADVESVQAKNKTLARWGLPEVASPDLSALEEIQANGGFKAPRAQGRRTPDFEVGTKVRPVSDDADFEIRSMYSMEDDRLLCAGLEIVKIIKASEAKNARVTIVVKNASDRTFVAPKHLIERA